MQEFDLIGLVLITAGILCLLFGFNESEKSCEILAFFKRYGLGADMKP